MDRRHRRWQTLSRVCGAIHCAAGCGHGLSSRPSERECAHAGRQRWDRKAETADGGCRRQDLSNRHRWFPKHHRHTPHGFAAGISRLEQLLNSNAESSSGRLRRANFAGRPLESKGLDSVSLGGYFEGAYGYWVQIFAEVRVQSRRCGAGMRRWRGG